MNPIEFDLTDGAGHGILVAVDKFYAQIHSTYVAWGGTGGIDFKFLYRFKKVSLAEYVGIVQSQQ